MQAVSGVGFDLERRVQATASRLRLIQADFADDDPGTRREQLAEAIELEVNRLVPEQREPFLEALVARFPSWTGRQAAPRAEVGGSGVDAHLLDDPGFLIRRLVELAGTLGPAQRRAIEDDLKSAGLVRTGGGSWSSEAGDDLRRKLGIKNQASIDPDRAISLLVLLSDFAEKLDQVIWKIWRRMDRRSEFRSSGPLVGTLGRFVSGDQDVARGQVSADLEKLRALTAALTTAAPRTGVSFAQNHVGRLSPSSIKQVTTTSKWKDDRVAYWDKFEELASVSMTESAVESEINRVIVEYVRSVLPGAGR